MTDRWSFGDSLLEIHEHGTVFADAALIDSVSPDVWSKVGLGIRRELGDSEDQWRVSASQYVGMARLGQTAASPQLAIRPKLGADIFFMADYAFEAQRDLLAEEQLRADLAALRDDPAACLLAWFSPRSSPSQSGGSDATTSFDGRSSRVACVDDSS